MFKWENNKRKKEKPSSTTSSSEASSLIDAKCSWCLVCFQD